MLNEMARWSESVRTQIWLGRPIPVKWRAREDSNS